ncbi:hypothetical protein B0J15DRAFT_496949 [Fusarium solani]|uniref:Uncharacterized protein n=1 Tax=Fusarium solani TaxID=169388 RepID=A0A9P9H5S1_FUSSL|nr:uncharacterized protein B0J15DRAFT_496949 [Fusarium solani]KAH7250838.1 hypothetical protein B0J15DRAFT_496949 [Fusarium solani]
MRPFILLTGLATIVHAGPCRPQISRASEVLTISFTAAVSTAIPVSSITTTVSGLPAPSTSTWSAKPDTTSTLIVQPAYGSNVDTADGLPAVSQVPGPLADRNDNKPADFKVTGNWIAPFHGSIGGDYIMMWTGSNVTLSGLGYFKVRWEVAWFNSVGQIRPPTWVGLEGKLFHVASGGGHRMDDERKSADCTWAGCDQCTWMGCIDRPDKKDSLPDGMQQMWQNEFYFLNGTVTLRNNEGPVDYNLAVTPVKWEQVYTDIHAGPESGAIRYGKSRDPTGDDLTPVPQYATYNITNDTISQRSELVLS